MEYVTIQNWGRSGMTACCSVVRCETRSRLPMKMGRETTELGGSGMAVATTYL